MFGTSIHWTTFFYLLVDIFIVVFAAVQSWRLSNNNFKRFMTLGLLFVAYNLTGGFLPFEGFPGPFILQYIITYGVAIAMCIYVVYYMYQEYDISVLKSGLSIPNITIAITICFVGLYLLPYYLTGSIGTARMFFTVPVSIICMLILWAFYRRISKPINPNRFILRRIRLSIISMACIALLPVLTAIGDYQWLTFTVVNLSFYTITAIEIDRYHFLLRKNSKLVKAFGLYRDKKNNRLNPKLLMAELTNRQIEVAMSILGDKTYKEIGEDFSIAESTVSKHASNIFKKAQVRNRSEFTSRFKAKHS